MTAPVVCAFVANDAVLEHALPFLAALREAAPDVALMLIPRDAAIAELAAFAPLYRFEILRIDFAALDHLEAICFGDAAAPGALRLLAAFDLPGAVIGLDLACRPDVAALAALLANAPDAGIFAADAARCVLLPRSHPPVAAVIAALRENLVAYMTGRPPGATPGPVLTVAMAALGVSCHPLAPALAPGRPSGGAALRARGLRDCVPDVVVLDNGGGYARPPGRVFGAPQRLVAARAVHVAQAAIEPPPALLARLRHATVHRRGIVVTQAGEVVRESLINSAPGSVPDGLADGAVMARNGAGPVVLLKQTWDHNYGHWLVESLPRLGLVAERHALSDCRFLVGPEDGAIGQVYRDSLALFGIGPSQIVAAPDTPRFCADLIYPAPLTAQPWVKAPRAVAFLQALARRVPEAGAGGAAGPARLFVARDRGGRRLLRNEDAIVRRLLPRGYVVVEPHRLDLAGQVRMFRHATHIIGSLGAGMANVAFAPRGVRVLALVTPFMQDDFFWDLVSLLGGDYVSQHGTAIGPTADAQSDFQLEESALERLMDAFDSRSAPVTAATRC